MKFTEVKEIPKKNKDRSNLRLELEEFMSMNIKIAQIDFKGNAYKNPQIAQGVIQQSCCRHGFPIKVIRRGGEVFLMRKDM